jgi:glucose-6-phosphate isomerase
VATEYALTRSGHLNNTLLLSEVNENTLGQLLMFFQLQTAYCGYMLNIDAFNQPGVEEGKNATYALFNRKGYEAKKTELENAPKKSLKYII